MWIRSEPAGLSYLDITRLTFEAVLQVVIICIAGFLAAKTGLLNTNGQKVISALNVDLFTPCLVFSKLAPSLSFKKMIDIIVIPIFYALSTSIAFLSSRIMGKFLVLNGPETDFVTAMAVFGNSNSLPVSLTLSLAYTLPDLYWDDIKDDTKDQVASRGILYLLIFQQLGQILRWSWGYNKLLRKRSHEELTTYHYLKHDTDEENRVDNAKPSEENTGVGSSGDAGISEASDDVNSATGDNGAAKAGTDTQGGGLTRTSDENGNNRYVTEHDDESTSLLPSRRNSNVYMITQTDINESDLLSSSTELTWSQKIMQNRFVEGFFRFMNPPLYAMLVSIVIASIPALQNLFFTSGTFVSNTVTKAINQLGSVSIPLILIVLGSNLYPSKDIPPASKNYKKIIIGSLLSRMILPSIILLPIIALCVKFFRISILDDPIFLLVAFILTTSPPAIQLSQITQLNNIYQKEMSGVLFWGYVVFSLPSTMLIVVLSLEVLQWANP